MWDLREAMKKKAEMKLLFVYACLLIFLKFDFMKFVHFDLIEPALVFVDCLYFIFVFYFIHFCIYIYFIILFVFS